MLMAKAMANFAPSLTVYWISRPKWAALNTAPQIYTKKCTNIYLDMSVCFLAGEHPRSAAAIYWNFLLLFGHKFCWQTSLSPKVCYDFNTPRIWMSPQRVHVCLCMCVSVCAACVCLCNRVCLNANLNNDNDINAPFSSCWLSSPFCVCFRSAIIIAKSVWGIASALSVYIYNICLCIARKYAYLGENERSM